MEATDPVNTLEKENTVREAVWPDVVQAGDKMDDHAKVSSSDAIIVVPAGTVIPRTDKGSIARREVYKLYGEQIAQVYQTLETRSIDSLVKPLDAEKLEQGLIDLIGLTFSEQKPSIAYHFENRE